MAVELKQISVWLNESEVKHNHDEEREVIVFAGGDEEHTQSYFIRARDKGEVFDLNMQLLDSERDNITIKDHPHAGLALAHMLHLNYNTKFGTWEYDPTDGDIRLAIEIPLEDAIMTQKQFDRIMGMAFRNGGDMAKEIRHILNTGEVPEDNSKDEMISQLEAMLAQLKGADVASDDGI